jgi:hypothetical protein
MGLGILFENGGPELRGDTGAARVVLYDADGTPLVRDTRTLVATKRGLPIAGYQEDVLRPLRVGGLGGVALSRVNALLFHDLVDGAAVNTQQWTQTLTTMTVTQAAPGVVTMNAGNSVAATVVAAHTSLARFLKPREGVVRMSARVRFDWNAAGSTIQIGFGTASTTAAQLVDGLFLQVSTSGTIRLVYVTSSADTASVDTGVSMGVSAADVKPTYWYDVDLYWQDDSFRVVMWESNGSTATEPVIDSTLNYTQTQIRHTSQRSLPVLLRVLNVTAPASANRLLYSEVTVMQQDIDEGRLFQHALARAGRSTLLNPTSGAQLANYANSAAPASATLSNTAAGYTTLGGQWQFAAVAGAETDYALFAFTVPTGMTLHVTGVRIETFVTGAAVAATVTSLQWFISRSAAVTLATNTFRKTLGCQSLAVGHAIGQVAAPINWQTDTPFVVESAQVLHLGLKMPVGTATASSVIRGVAVIEGYLE